MSADAFVPAPGMSPEAYKVFIESIQEHLAKIWEAAENVAGAKDLHIVVLTFADNFSAHSSTFPSHELPAVLHAYAAMMEQEKPEVHVGFIGLDPSKLN